VKTIIATHPSELGEILDYVIVVINWIAWISIKVTRC
jgi:hypothetical protein